MNINKLIIDTSNYVEEENIGEGNNSSVYLVHPKDQKDKKYALKKIPGDMNDKDLRERFEKEVTLMSNLNHPNLIKLIGFAYPSQKDHSYQILSNYLPNHTLEEVLKKDIPLPDENKLLNPTRMTIIIYGIASAMLYIHRRNIVHRDLKPENIFLNEDYRPVLSDFGLSLPSKENSSGTKTGSPYFMAPELFYDEDESLTNKVDVYAFGVTLYSLFSMSYKFEGVQPRTINQLINKVINGKRFVIPKDVPQFYSKLIKKCWSDDPKERPSFEEIVKEFNCKDDFILPGADKSQVHDYIDKILKFNSDKIE